MPSERDPDAEPTLDHQTRRKWYELSPEQALTEFENITDGMLDSDVDLPLNENGEPCPWPYDPQQLVGAPLGQYHCPYCGAMVLAGMPHLDYR